MIFTQTALAGATIIDLERREDERGFFARTFCRKEFADAGLDPMVEQCNLSYNYKAGTLRGMHYQVAPAEEAKLVRCTSGAILDVIVDMRPDSPTHLQHIAVELTQQNRRALLVPPMFAHGYLTLTDDAEVVYQVSETYTPGTERGLRYDDPALGIDWPVEVAVISAKDAAWPLLSEQGISA
ncbi:dTDP-4-dehydrorhamnose 3,5-epimerase [Motilibacter rhizosphaerae]|uniref:dTDP-4-dehydrorhamnose 3,5-epimerase n=1 Tax=Motilibacter rhizosphaerae TaxID=598652 RepID=A0A4Q7NQ47_9ACTN|nr:dTDP-4-dehydrorhamnose 3,5-epimerase [Motilibacter rhizosphaerae]RZS87409.1 dTDP-4-dehydrorhamnose 3,5-epimerase [Motilibacter rhizosphaerae]